MKGVVRFGKISYKLKLPSELSSIHHVFHISMRKKCIGNTDSILPIEGLGVNENLSHEVVTIEILDRQVKDFRNKEVGRLHTGVIEESPS